jgi:hypothetical protein
MNIRFWQNSISSWKIAYSGFINGAAIPDFQRTRGALRFPATRSAQAAGKSRALFGPCDVPLHDPQVRLAFLRRLGSDPIFSHALSMTSSGQMLVPAASTSVVRRSFPFGR